MVPVYRPLPQKRSGISVKKPVEVIEYQKIFCKEDQSEVGEGEVALDKASFDQLSDFIASRNQELEEKRGEETREIMKFTSTKRGKKALQAINYVGVIALKSGCQIEILPKTCESDTQDTRRVTRRIFMKMLQATTDFPRAKAARSSLDTEKMPMLEIFFRFFIDELLLLIKRGLKSDYLLHRDNERIFKGKLIFPEHIKRNAVHKERFFVEYDEFSINRPENRLIKSTVMLLLRLSHNSANLKDLNIIRAMLADIEESANYDSDLAKVSYQRTAVEYKNVMDWCRLFLKKLTYTTFSGKNINFAFLFPMERVFESYVAKKVRTLLPSEYTVSVQDKSRWLFDYPRRMFPLRPDIVIKKNGKPKLILDTKWKLLSDPPSPDQADMYQMYAYLNRFKVDQVHLLYPKTRNTEGGKKIDYSWGDGPDKGKIIGFRFFDLEVVENNISMLDELLGDEAGTP